MQTLNQLKIGNVVYDLAAKFDAEDNNIIDTYSTKEYVTQKISELVNSAPETLDTLNELANALGNDPNFATTVANQIGTKANDNDVVHKSGDETIAGNKTFSNRVSFPSDYYITTDTNDNSLRIIRDGTGHGNNYKVIIQGDTGKFFAPNGFIGNLQGNADTATKATNNASGNELSNNIIKGLSVSGKVITYTKLDGSTGTITTQDTNTWTAFKGATSSANGTAGYVPAPTKGNQDKFFKADGTWATPTNTTYSVATTSTNGLMSSTDKTKLDGLSNYTLPTASSTLGGVKTTSSVTSTSGLTACPIISGVVYYKDSNTDVKVTNTLNNTTKAYITGTTSATTNTGTQIFDTGVYLTTTAGQLHADIDFPITEAQVNEILGIA